MTLTTLISSILLLFCTGNQFADAAGGKWDVLLQNIGVSAMHMQLLKNDRVVIFDRTDFGASNISLPEGKCRNDPNDNTLKIDCTAHSVEYDVASNSIRPLMVQTDVWCSSGSVTPEGNLVQTGGFNDGEKHVRTFSPCPTCDWVETPAALTQRRWYATNQILPDGRQIIIGGRRQFNYEFYPKSAGGTQSFSLPFLVQTNDPKIENNLYPFVHLNVDGNLFLFANNRAILLDYVKNQVVRTYPEIPGGDPRSYPSTGSSVLLPLTNLQGNVEAEVLVCGGAPKGSFVNSLNGKFIKALDTCGRIKITDPSPQWVMEKMPFARVMGDMLLLPDGNVIIINGGSSGAAGWEGGRDPVLSPVIYRPNNPIGSRFEVQNPTTVPRLYHSTAVLLRDGRVLVGGSNPHANYVFSGVLFPTELSMESFSPSYLDSVNANLRPVIISPASQSDIGYKKRMVIQFTVAGRLDKSKITVNMISPSFTTHSVSMNHRLLVLGHGVIKGKGKNTYEVGALTPNSGNQAPSGYYLLHVVHQDIPSQGIWIRIR